MFAGCSWRWKIVSATIDYWANTQWCRVLELDLFKELIIGVLYPLDDEGPKFSPPQCGPFGFNVEINACFPLPPFSANFGTDCSSFSSPTFVNLSTCGHQTIAWTMSCNTSGKWCDAAVDRWLRSLLLLTSEAVYCMVQSKNRQVQHHQSPAKFHWHDGCYSKEMIKIRRWHTSITPKKWSRSVLWNTSQWRNWDSCLGTYLIARGTGGACG